MVLPERLLGSRAAQGLPTGEKPQSCPPLPGDDPWQLRPPSGQAEGCTRIAAPSLGWQSCPLSPNTVSRGPASKAPSSLPRNLHASTRDSLGGPGAGPRAQDGSVSGGDRSPSPMPHTGQGVGAEEGDLEGGGLCIPLSAVLRGLYWLVGRGKRVLLPRLCPLCHRVSESL